MLCRKKIRLTPDEVTAIARALADPRRFAMLQQIAAVPVLPCCQLQAHGDLSPATISHHVKELTEAGLIDSEREGRGMNLTLRRNTWSAYVEQLARL